MPSPKYTIDDTATALVASHGLGARQKVIDQIIACVREHDIHCAKRWEEVGRKVDEGLGLVVAIEVDKAMEKAITSGERAADGARRGERDGRASER